jgi:probable HAF family extracellular repeat protein
MNNYMPWKPRRCEDTAKTKGRWTRRCASALQTVRKAVRALGAGLLLVLASAAPGVSPANATSYTFTDLGTLGGISSQANDINNHGQVVGYSQYAGGSSYYHAFLYDSGGMHDLGDLGYPASVATAINDLGQVAGYSNITGNVAQHGFLYDSTGMHDLGVLGGSTSCNFAEL